MKSIRRYLVAGILVWVPLAVTYLLIRFAVGIMDQTLKWIPRDYQPGILLQQLLGDLVEYLWPVVGDEATFGQSVEMIQQQISSAVVVVR